jgi:hypothetical protein
MSMWETPDGPEGGDDIALTTPTKGSPQYFRENPR